MWLFIGTWQTVILYHVLIQCVQCQRVPKGGTSYSQSVNVQKHGAFSSAVEFMWCSPRYRGLTSHLPPYDTPCLVPVNGLKVHVDGLQVAEGVCEHRILAVWNSVNVQKTWCRSPSGWNSCGTLLGGGVLPSAYPLMTLPVGCLPMFLKVHVDCP